MYAYPAAVIDADDDLVVVTFRDVPEAVTQASKDDDISEKACEALIKALSTYLKKGETTPKPSLCRKGELLVELPFSTSAKLLLLNKMIEDKVDRKELIDRTHYYPQRMSNVFNLEHTTKIDTIQLFFNVLGYRLTLETERAGLENLGNALSCVIESEEPAMAV